MSLIKPYFRIQRPVKGHSSDYIYDKRYASDRSILCRTYHILEDDLKTLFEYIEPNDNNRYVYSHRTYELFLRAATEFETNCKRILVANNYTKSGNFDVLDYYKINQATKLSEYKIRLESWSPNELRIKPFDDWRTNKPLSWYQSYNLVKHNRNQNFEEASLENLLFAITGVFVILFAQFGVNVFNPHHRVDSYRLDGDFYLYDLNTMFSIKEPRWLESESYDFDWNVLCKQSNPFTNYNFI